MDTFIVHGGIPLKGEITVGGAKNVALKALVASVLTTDPLIIRNVPDIGDVRLMLDVIKSLGAKVDHINHEVSVQMSSLSSPTVPLEVGARLRTSSMVVGPLLARFGEAHIPNPGGCRIGARPIDRHIEALQKMGATIDYDSGDGYFHATATKLHGATIHFPKNTHTGTETLILAAVLAEGVTILENAAEEVEVDDLIGLLNAMGADIQRTASREISIKGVKSLHGATYEIMSDRNEEVTLAIAGTVTDGSITVHNSSPETIKPFLEVYSKAGGKFESIDPKTTRYFGGGELLATDVMTAPHPGFMTDWQAPWALMMTQANGVSTIHETVFESRFSYVEELKKMGAHIEFYNPEVESPEIFYNFNWGDRVENSSQAIKITGPTKLHNAVLNMNDLRAGATILLGALLAPGESFIHGVDQIDRGYENIESRFRKLGADIKREHTPYE